MTWLQEVVDFSAETVRAGTFPELNLRVGQARAEFDSLTGQPAVEQWRVLIKGWDRLQLPYEASRSRWRLAAAVLAAETGDRWNRDPRRAHCFQRHGIRQPPWARPG